MSTLQTGRAGSTARWLVAVSALIAAAGAGCTNSGSASDASTQEGEAAAEIPQCERFLASYARTLEALGPPEAVQVRIAQTRAGLEAEAKQGAAERKRLARRCAENLRQLWNGVNP